MWSLNTRKNLQTLPQHLYMKRRNIFLIEVTSFHTALEGCLLAQHNIQQEHRQKSHLAGGSIGRGCRPWAVSSLPRSEWSRRVKKRLRAECCGTETACVVFISSPCLVQKVHHWAPHVPGVALGISQVSSDAKTIYIVVCQRNNFPNSSFHPVSWSNLQLCLDDEYSGKKKKKEKEKKYVWSNNTRKVLKKIKIGLQKNGWVCF